MIFPTHKIYDSLGLVADYPAVTARYWSLSCIPIKNGTGLGQGFIAVSPAGTKYYFDWLVNKPATVLQKGYAGSNPTATTARSSDYASVQRRTDDDAEQSDVTQVSSAAPLPSTDLSATAASLTRYEVWLMPSKVVDRFGNYVNYTYDSLKPANLVQIASNDSRVITLTYNSTGMIDSVLDGTAATATRTWKYLYHNNSDGKQNLDQVIQPDNTYWNFANFDALLTPLTLVNDGGCDQQPYINNYAATGSIVHPSGATGTFTISPTVHGRSHVDNTCPPPLSGEPHLLTPRYFASLSLTKKTLSGAGLGTMVWSYDYGPTNESWSTCTTCISTKTVTVTDPAGQVNRFTFGNQHNVNEGRLELSETGWSESSVLRSTSHRYKPFGAGPYPNYMGTPDPANTGDGDFSARPECVNRFETPGLIF
jgi:hypothetical protein